MLYVIALVCLLTMAFAAMACHFSAQAYNAASKQHAELLAIRKELDGHWKGHGYMHAQTRALITGDPPPQKSDYWT